MLYCRLCYIVNINTFIKDIGTIQHAIKSSIFLLAIYIDITILSNIMHKLIVLSSTNEKWRCQVINLLILFLFVIVVKG